MTDGYKVNVPSNVVQLDSNNGVGGAFGRLRVCEPETLFDSKQLYDNQPLFWDDQEVSGSGTTSTYNANQASTTLAVSASTAGRRVRQTYQSFNYQPGKPQLIFMTGVMTTGGTGLTGRMGLGNDNNGIFVQSVDGTVQFNRRTYTSGSVVNNTVDQADWNLDPLDGTGPSGFTLDATKTQIFIIDLEWLGVGRVRVGFVMDGVVVYCHQFLNANYLSLVYISTPNLPLRYELENDGTGGAASLTHICSSVISEGGSEELGFIRSLSTNGTHIDANTENVLYAIAGLRLKSAYIGSVVKIISAAIQIQNASKTGEWRLLLNPTVAGTFTYSDITNSPLQGASGATANTVTGGTQLSGGFGFSPAGGGGAGDILAEINTSRYLGAAIDGTVDEIVLCWMPNGGTSSHDVEGSLTWREL